jgi:anti-anti-sigma regulatory factor
MSRSTVLQPSLEIRDVEELRRQLLDLLSGAAALSVDVGSIATADTAGVQLLLALKSEAERRGIPLEFTGKSAALDRALTILGLSKTIGGSADHVA